MTLPAFLQEYYPLALNNSLCDEAHLIVLGDDVIVASLENAIKQVVVFCESPDQYADSQLSSGTR